eukprot:scaffold7316_cov123-Cylindrotheca_fusiformis.AAC.11
MALSLRHALCPWQQTFNAVVLVSSVSFCSTSEFTSIIVVASSLSEQSGNNFKKATTKQNTMKPQAPSTIKSRSSHASSLNMTPWQECMLIIKSLKTRRHTKKRKTLPAQRVLQAQSDEVDFLGQGESNDAQGCLFEYLNDKPEPTEQNLFRIGDDEDGDDELFSPQ